MHFNLGEAHAAPLRTIHSNIFFRGIGAHLRHGNAQPPHRRCVWWECSREVYSLRNVAQGRYSQQRAKVSENGQTGREEKDQEQEHTREKGNPKGKRKGGGKGMPAAADGS